MKLACTCWQHAFLDRCYLPSACHVVPHWKRALACACGMMFNLYACNKSVFGTQVRCFCCQSKLGCAVPVGWPRSLANQHGLGLIRGGLLMSPAAQQATAEYTAAITNNMSMYDSPH